MDLGGYEQIYLDFFILWNISIGENSFILKCIFLILPVAVVVAFFLCWAPFHSQRLMTVFLEKEEDWTPELLKIQSVLFYISGND